VVSVVAYNVTDAFIAAVRSADHCMPADGEELVYAVERTSDTPTDADSDIHVYTRRLRSATH
jgi:hypothetical protein